MTARKILGGLLLAAPFAGIFTYATIAGGLLVALAGFGGAFGLFGAIIAGIHLIYGP